MSHGHDHGARAGARHAGRLAAALVVVAVVLVVELVAGIVTGSLALLSDAGHMATDVLGLGMALAAVHLAGTGGTRGGRSFGLYRLEILAALANAVLLLGIAAYVLYEAVERLGSAPALDTTPVLGAATVGLLANVVAFLLLRRGAEESLNVRGAYLEVVADLAGSVAVIVSTVGIAVTGWYVLDTVTGAAIGLWILPRTIRLGGAAVRILVQAAPQRIDLERLTAELLALPAVVGVHDVHVWTLTSEMDVATAHLVVADTADAHAVLDQARELLEQRWSIPHATLQVEPADHTGCDELSW